MSPDPHDAIDLPALLAKIDAELTAKLSASVPEPAAATATFTIEDLTAAVDAIRAAQAEQDRKMQEWFNSHYVMCPASRRAALVDALDRLGLTAPHLIWSGDVSDDQLVVFPVGDGRVIVDPHGIRADR